MRRILEETLKLCRDIEMIVVTKQRAKDRKNVAKNPPKINNARQRKFVVTSETCVATIMRWSQMNFVTTFPKFVAKYNEEGKEILSRYFKLCRNKDEEKTSEIHIKFVMKFHSFS